MIFLFNSLFFIVLKTVDNKKTHGKSITRKPSLNWTTAQKSSNKQEDDHRNPQIGINFQPNSNVKLNIMHSSRHTGWSLIRIKQVQSYEWDVDEQEYGS